MWRRLYLSFPDFNHAKAACDELIRGGIKRAQLHAISDKASSLPGLPYASDEQRRDRVWFWEQLFWNGNLVLFGMALLGFILALANGATGWALACAAVMLATFLGGNYFASELPHAHLNQMKEPLQHGEVVLLVDLPAEQVARVEHAITRHHPEAGGHVVGWTIPGAGF